jgi:hypothetical protein
MKRKTLNLVEVFNIDKAIVSHGTFHFSMRFMGETPGGKELDVVIDFPAWGVQYIGEKLHEVLKKQEHLLSLSRSALMKGTIL